MSKIDEDAGVKSTKNIVNSDESCNNIDYSKEVDDWGLLISKHPLRMKIWSILKIYGISGKLAYETRIYQQDHKLHLVGMKPGTYLLSSEVENAQKAVGRLIIF